MPEKNLFFVLMYSFHHDSRVIAQVIKGDEPKKLLLWFFLMIRGLVNLKISKWLTFVNWYIHDLLKDNYDTITYCCLNSKNKDQRQN